MHVLGFLKQKIVSGKQRLLSSYCSVVYGMVPFLNAILGTMLPMLGIAKQDNMKWVFSSGKSHKTPNKSSLYSFTFRFLFSNCLFFSWRCAFPCFPLPALCHFSDSILEYLANLDKAPDPTVRKDTFCSEIYAAYDILFNTWIQSREPKVRRVWTEQSDQNCSRKNLNKLPL